jgi:large subunit ribosomal protein L25
MDVITLEAGTRDVKKKGARAVRRDGNVPCVLYGRHVDPIVFQVSEKSLKPLIFTDENHLVNVKLDGQAWDCIIKDLSFHPVTDRPIHVDFQVLQEGEKITLTVPVRYLGTPIGQTEGGVTNFAITELEISCLPKDIPSAIEVDISHLNVNEALHVSDLDLEDIEIHALDRQTLVAVVPPRAEEVVEEDEGILLEGEEGAEGEEGEEDEGDEDEEDA